MDLLPSTEEIAGRFRVVRGMIKLSRKDFCAKHNLNRFTVQAWEIGRNHINPRLVHRFCEALSTEGIFCSPDWILKGKGTMPSKLSMRQDLPAELPLPEAGLEPQLIQTEIKLFREHQAKLQRTPVVLELADQAMRPHFSKGDYVGGWLLPERSMDTLLGQMAIIGVGVANYVVRRLMKEGSNYLLIPADFTGRAVSVKKLESVAKIVWHRTL